MNQKSIRLPANQSLKLTAEAWARTRYAQENGFIIANAPLMKIKFRVVRKEGNQRRNLAPVR